MPALTSALSAALGAALAALACASALAAPRTPSDDQEVIERLPSRLPGTAPRQRTPLVVLSPGTATAAAPSAAAPNLPQAVARARQAIDQARRSGDPRDWGQAQAALGPWWADTPAPPAVRLLRAIVRQGQHDFSAALADLDGLLAPRVAAANSPAFTATAMSPASLRRGAADATGPASLPVLAQAELTRASIHQVQGRYAQAREGCERLAGATYAALGEAVQAPARACLVELDSLQGRSRWAATDRALAAIGPATTGSTDDPWLALLRGEAAQRAGRPDAGRHFHAATSGPAPAIYALAAHADWLLEQHRPAEAEQLLRGYEAVDALLLRQAIARRALGGDTGPLVATLIAQLQARFDAALARGDQSHAREQARFALDLLGDPTQALALAQSNWAWQREPADALLLLRAAEAAGQAEAGAPVRQWAAAQGFTDARWPSAGSGRSAAAKGSKLRSASAGAPEPAAPNIAADLPTPPTPPMRRGTDRRPA